MPRVGDESKRIIPWRCPCNKQDWPYNAPRADFYTQSRPTPADVLLLIEVSDSSLDYDQETKLPLYVAAGIREVWIVNLPEQSIDCYSGPTAQGYRLCERFFPGDRIHPAGMTNVAVDVQYILNPLA